MGGGGGGESYHEVEASHQKHEVDQQQPMALQRHLTFRNECPSDISTLISNKHALFKGIGFWKAETENDDQNWRAGAKPEERAPSVRCSVHKTSRKGCGHEISKCVTLLEHTGNDTTSFLRTIFKGCSCGIAVKPTHCNTEQGSAGKKLFVGLAEPSA